MLESPDHGAQGVPPRGIAIPDSLPFDGSGSSRRTRGLGEALKRLVFGRVYSIGIYTGPSPLALTPGPGIHNPVLTRDSVTDVLATYVADPFMIKVSSAWYMFFEVLTWRPGLKKGEIALARSTDGMTWGYRGIVLSERFHLSYPYVFRSGSDHYMIPESAMATSVRLYRAEPFPDRWVFVKNLLSGSHFTDSSIFERDGTWWILTQTGGPPNPALRLFQARDLTGPWREHPRSPIVTGDPRIARPAGRVLSTTNRLMRFAQDCRREYGTSVRALEISRLTSSEYEEIEIHGNPILAGSGHGWNRSGMHQLDAHEVASGRWVACVDGWANQVRRPREIFRWAADHAR